jgi:hypothetical protein
VGKPWEFCLEDTTTQAVDDRCVEGVSPLLLNVSEQDIQPGEYHGRLRAPQSADPDVSFQPSITWRGSITYRQSAAAGA